MHATLKAGIPLRVRCQSPESRPVLGPQVAHHFTQTVPDLMKGIKVPFD
jgi:hypothetical protein